MKHWISIKRLSDYFKNEDAEKIKISIFTGYCTKEQALKICEILGVEYK